MSRTETFFLNKETLVVKIIRQWFNRYFSDPEAVLLSCILILGFGLVFLFGGILAPVLVSLVFAYLLEWVVKRLQKLNIPRLPAVLIVFIGFLALFLLAIFFIMPLIWHQLVALFQDLPTMLTKGEKILLEYTNKYPEILSPDQLQEVASSAVSDVRVWGKAGLAASIFYISSVLTWLVYLVLMPLLLFFFLKDKDQILKWLSGFLPRKRGVLRQVSREVNDQIGNYIRGKIFEIIIVGIVTYIAFWFFGLQYAALLGFLVGLSVLIPYVGIVVVSIPVILVAYLQWGFNSPFGYFLIVYALIQGLDANLLVPVLFSEAVNLHPVAIIVATLFFGGIWGFWGIFFAIPLATLIKAVINAWPKHSEA